MGDVDDPDAVGTEPLHHAEEALLLLPGERSGRFVHDDDPGTGTEGTGDLHQLLLRHRERSDLRIGIDLGSDTAQQLLGGFSPGAPSDPAERPESLEPDPDVFRHREVGEQRRLLIDAGDTEAMGFSGREGRDPVAADLDGAFIGLMSAGDDLDQCRFAGAVLAQQRMHLSGPQVERNAFERPDGPEGLGHGSQLEQTTHQVTGAIESSKKPFKPLKYRIIAT